MPKPKAKTAGLHLASAAEQDSVQYVNAQFTRAEQARALVADDWLLNKAFIRGFQWAEIADNSHELKAVSRKEWKKQVTANLMFSTERVVVAKTSAQDPKPSVTPATNTDEDREAARGLEGLIKYHWRKQDMDVEWICFLSEQWSTGGGWWKCIWNPEAGEIIRVEDDIAEEFDIPQQDRVRRTGDIEVSAPSPFNIFVDPGASNDRQARWIIHVHYLHVDEVWERWDEEVDADSPSQHGASWVRDTGSDYEGYSELAMVKEYWERPSKAYPGGRRYVVAGDKLLESEEPAADDVDAIFSLPFIYIPFYPDTESFYGITPVSFSREMQRNLNQTISLIVEQSRLHAHGKWLIPKGNGTIRITSMPGEKIEYNPTHGPPTWLRGDPVAPSMLQLVEFFRTMKQFVDGVHDASQGASQGASQSGRAVVFQAEEDNTKLGPTLKLLRAGMKRLGRLMLETWQRHADGSLNYRIQGGNGASQIHSIEAGNIRFEDVEFTVDNNLPDNKEARRQTIMELFQIGLVEPEKALGLMEFGDLDELTGSQDRDKQRARNENERMMAGEQIEPMGHEDHLAHLQVHLAAMKEDKWYSASPEVMAVFQMHINQTAALMQGGGDGSAPVGPEQGGGGPAPMTTPNVPGMQDEASVPGGQLQDNEMAALAAISGAPA